MPGRTLEQLAQDRGISWNELVFAHETTTFLAYESIERDTTGRPNVVISRNGFSNESAVYGDGFYTQIGTVGARGTGLTIRFRPTSPYAIEGQDFLVHGTYVVWRNRAALRVIPESLHLTPLEYLKLLAGGGTFNASDKGLQMKLKRKLSSLLPLLPPVQERELVDFVLHEIQRVEAEGRTPNDSNLVAVLTAWFELPCSTRYPEVLGGLIQASLLGSSVDAFIAAYVLSQPHWKEHPDWVE